MPLNGRSRRGLADPLHTDEANVLLAEGGYRLSLRRSESGGFRLVGPGAGSGVPLPEGAGWADLYAALVRMRRTRQRRDPGQLRELVSTLDATSDNSAFRFSEPKARHRHRGGWTRLTTAVESDSVLRMHCATLRDADVAYSSAEPHPCHPNHPGGTVAVGIPALLREPRDGLLAHVIENRFERREDELSYFLDHFVRPLLRVFRLAADGHRTGLFSLHEWGVAVELSPELEATGRVVVTDCSRITDIHHAQPDEVSGGMEALLSTVDSLAGAFSLIDFGTTAFPEGTVRAAVDRVIAEELRYLESGVAQALAGDHSLRHFVHSVPRKQDELLKRILHTVQERSRQRRWDLTRPRPVVVIDLDLCGLVPLRRTLDAAKEIAGPRPGAPDGIAELAWPTGLAVLPTYAESTWHNFIELSGLDEKYPEVEWRKVYTEFFRAFSRPWERVRTDTVNAGLARFVWDVQDAGGQVVFCTGRRERVRRYTEEVLDDAGVPGATVLCMPDARSRPISEMKVEKLRELGPVDVIAVFDDLHANRIAIAKEYPGAIAVAVEIPGLATERQPGQPVPDEAPVISTFETSPRRRTSAAKTSSLSNTHSLEELQVAALRKNRLAKLWPVRLDQRATLSIVDNIVQEADRAADRTVRSARARFATTGASAAGASANDAVAGREHLILLLHHLFTRKQFFKGSRSHYQPADLRSDITPFLATDQPIEVVLLGFPVKQYLNRLKAFGPLPDLAELGALVRLRELQRAVRAVYPPGLHFNILTDGRHFRPRPPAVTEAYSRKLREYAALAGIEGCSTIEEIDVVARQRLGPDLPAEWAARVNRYRRVLADLLHGYDITDNPLRVLELITEQADALDGPDSPALSRALGMFREMLMSMVFSVPVAAFGRMDRISFSRMVYADIYNLSGKTVTTELRQARCAVLRRAWHTVIRYLATVLTDEELGYDTMFGHRVRLTVSAAHPGRCGFTYLGGSGLLPWQGTGVVDCRGQVAADFAVFLLDQGFVPVYSDLLGPRQPWMMLPADQTRLRSGHADGLSIDEEFAARFRLRRK